MNRNDIVIQTNQLSKRYKGFTALDRVSLSVEQGDIYGLVGKNGAGKTTLFKVLMGLTGRSSGEMSIYGSCNISRGRSSVGLMIGTTFFPYFTATQNMEYYCRVKGISQTSVEIKRVLELVGLYGERKPFKNYSLGMKQRLGIANALLGNPPIMILDEPVNGLDPQGIIDVRELLKELNETEGTTIILSSHILSELDLVANRFGFIDHGRLLQEISYEQLHRQENTLEEYYMNLVKGGSV